MTVVSPLIGAYRYTERHTRAALLLVIIVSGLYFTWLQASPNFGDPDAFYHLQMAKYMSHDLVMRDFPYLQSSFLQHNFIDQHFLYHLALIPFVLVFPDWIGVKVAQVMFGVIFMAVFYLVLRGLKTPGAAWWTLLLLWAESFVFRLNLVKAQPLSLILLFTALYALIKGKYWWLLGLSWLYVWTYGGWLIMLVVTVLYVLVRAASLLRSEPRSLRAAERMVRPPMMAGQSWSKRGSAFLRAYVQAVFRRDQVRAVMMVVMGISLGLVINPYFPHNLAFTWVQAVQIGLMNFPRAVQVGAEWYPYSPLSLITNALLPLTVAIGAIAVYSGYGKKMDVAVKFFCLLTIVFFGATIKARRYLEYFLPMAVFFSALVFTQGARLAEVREVGRRLFRHRTVPWIVVLFIVGSGIFSAVNATTFLHHGYPHDYGARAAAFLQTHAQAGQIVFNVSWDMFPLLLYHNPDLHYLVGLDPMFTYVENPSRYAQWQAISSGQGSADLAAIKDTFHADYVWVDQPETTEHQRLMAQFKQSTLMTMIYLDHEAGIFQVQ